MTHPAATMQTVVLAGGLGTRLGALAAAEGKPMVDVCGYPFIELLLRQLVSQGLQEFLLCLGHRAAALQDRLGDGGAIGARIRYSFEDHPLGTAGALGRAGDMIDGRTFILSNGDSMVDLAVADLLDRHYGSAALVTMTVTPAELTGRFGTVELDREQAVTSFVEKPASASAGLVNAGVYACHRDLLDRLPRETPASLERQVLPALVGHGLEAYVAPGPLVDIGTPESLEAARRDAALLLRLADVRERAAC
jgi:NDP-sugar pyrophosphorylase family protein